MKRFKKLTSVMLTALMTLAMAAPVFAEQAADVTHNYEVYQIFTGKFSGTDESAVLSDVKWGKNAKNQTVGSDVTETILENIENLAKKTDNEKAAILAGYADLTGDPYTTLSGKNDDNITVNVNEPGYYLIKDVDGSQSQNQVLSSGNYALYMVKVVNKTLTFKPKVGVPTVDKEIRLSDNSLSKNSNGAIGDIVNYEFTGTMPDNIDLYNTYLYKFTDTLSKGLTYNDDIKVVIRNEGSEDVDVTKLFYKSKTDYNEASGTTITVGMKDIKVLTFSDATHDAKATITKDTKVVVTYSATIRDNAVIGDKGNPNKVDLEYSNNPNDSGTGTTPPPEIPDEPKSDKPTGKTPESVVVTYTTELKIHKTMEGENVLPTGVEFTLTGTNLKSVKVETGTGFVPVEDNTGTYYKLKDGTYTTQDPIIEDTPTQKNNKEYYESLEKKYKLADKSTVTTVPAENQKVTATVGEDGYLTFAGLSEGTYTLEESETPDGYNTINPITIEIKYANGKFTVKWTQKDVNNVEQTGNGSGNNDVIKDDNDNTFSTDIENKKGSLLPSTGGIGTTIFYIVGGILVVGAAILLVTKKRMSREA